MTTCPMSGACCHMNWGKLSLKKHLDLGVMVNIQHRFKQINYNNAHYSVLYLSRAWQWKSNTADALLVWPLVG